MEHILTHDLHFCSGKTTIMYLHFHSRPTNRASIENFGIIHHRLNQTLFRFTDILRTVRPVQFMYFILWWNRSTSTSAIHLSIEQQITQRCRIGGCLKVSRRQTWLHAVFFRSAFPPDRQTYQQRVMPNFKYNRSSFG